MDGSIVRSHALGYLAEAKEGSSSRLPSPGMASSSWHDANLPNCRRRPSLELHRFFPSGSRHRLGNKRPDLRVTAAGVADLQRKLPNCKVFDSFDLVGGPDRGVALWILGIGGNIDVSHPADIGDSHRWKSRIQDSPTYPTRVITPPREGDHLYVVPTVRVLNV